MADIRLKINLFRCFTKLNKYGLFKAYENIFDYSYMFKTWGSVIVILYKFINNIGRKYNVLNRPTCRRAMYNLMN